MAGRETVALLLLHPRAVGDREAHEHLCDCLSGAQVGRPDELGIFEVIVDAEDREEALSRVWNAVAASGCDDHVVFLEHPELPEHWRHVSRRPSADSGGASA